MFTINIHPYSDNCFFCISAKITKEAIISSGHPNMTGHKEVILLVEKDSEV